MSEFNPEPLIEDLTTALDKRTQGKPVHPDEFDALAEFTVAWFEQRGLLPQSPGSPVLFMLTDNWRNARLAFLGIHPSLTDAQVAARVAVAQRGRAAPAGDQWVESADVFGHRTYKWTPINLGAPVGDFLITEVRVSGQ